MIKQLVTVEKTRLRVGDHLHPLVGVSRKRKEAQATEINTTAKSGRQGKIWRVY